MEKNPRILLPQQLLWVPIGAILPHPAYNSQLEHAIVNYIAQGPLFSDEGIRRLLARHPIGVVKLRHGKKHCYTCVSGGSRLFALAQRLPDKEEIPVIEFVSGGPEIVTSSIASEALMDHLIYSLRDLSAVGRLFDLLPKEELEFHFEKNCRTRTGIVRALGRCRNSVFPGKKDL